MSTRSIAHTPNRQHWKPAVPLWGVVYGRIGLGILEAAALGVVVAIWSAIGGALGAMAFAPHSLTQLTLVTWALFMLIACTLEQPWKTPMSYEEMKERGRQTRLMTREHFAEEIADGRMTFRPIDDEGYLLNEDGNRIETDRSTNL